MRTAGVILAGGAGRRLGGVDKAFVPLGGQPLVDHVIARFGPQVSHLAVSANGDAARYGDRDLTVLPDRAEFHGLGPLAGVLAGLDWACEIGADSIVTVTVDAPFVPLNLVARLQDAGVPSVAASGGRRHNATAIWPVSLRERIAAHLRTGQLRIGAVLSGAPEPVFEGEPDPFMNINDPSELQAAEALLRRARA